MASISIGVALIVLFSALIHASWNAILKSSTNKLIDTTVICFFGGLICLIAIPFLPVVESAAWPYILVSSIVHVFYFIFLANAYKHSDFSHAYPLIRGAAPPLVALLAFFIVGEELPLIVWAGIILISLGIILPGRIQKGEATLKSVFFILATAVCIVTYTLIDGLGVRVSGSAASYVTYMSLIEGIILVSVMIFYLSPKEIISYARNRWHLCALAAFLSIFGYGLVLWAMNHAPIGVVSALRETSIIFGTLIGIYFFKEGFGRKRLVTAALICLGALMIKMY